MNIKLSKHAAARLSERFDNLDVLTILKPIKDRIQESNATEVRVIVKRYSKWKFTTGSNGDTVVCMVNPKNMIIKTVMLKCDYQLTPSRGVHYMEIRSK